MHYDPEHATVILTVEELCFRALRGGDLDLRPGKGKGCSRPHTAMSAELSEKLLQSALSSGAKSYHTAVPFCNTTVQDGLCYEVSGTADGILEGEIPTVEQVRTVRGKAFAFPPNAEEEAVGRCLAYFLCRERNLAHVSLRMTFVKAENEETRFSENQYTKEEAERFYRSLLGRIASRARTLEERRNLLLPSAAASRFPYPSVREGQDQLIRECYRDIRQGNRLFAEAPTGIGKTLSVLYPAVRALGEDICDRIFYLTAKASTSREAFRAAGQLFSSGAHLRTVVLTAREQICKNEPAKADPSGVSGHCNPQDCPYAKGFYDRCNDAVETLLSEHSGYSRTAIEACAERFSVCPYELELELSELCDIIICDYNYVFDPQVYLRRYFSPDAEDAKNVFLVDEAHNLPERARAMYSAQLCNRDAIEAWKALPETETGFREALRKLILTMQGFRRLCRDTLQKDENGVEHGYDLNHGAVEPVLSAVRELIPVADGWLRKNREHAAKEQTEVVSRFLSALKRYDLISGFYDRSFLTFIELEGEIQTIRQICLDPSAVLDTCMKHAKASILFSATLTPADYFADILGGGKNAVRISLPSPFDPDHLCLAAVTGVSTRYEDREKSYRRIVKLIAATVSCKRGNYIVYFPSYAYLEEVRKRFAEKYPGVELVCQTRQMRPEEREHFTDAFADDGKLRVGFCVLGGSFSEGVDLPGKRLIGTVIVGTGLPGLSNERNILRDYYETTRERGYDYAYTYPGMNRVLQAAGRVIRREEDRGVVVLIDDRYAEAGMRAIFPPSWEHLQYAGNSFELAELVRLFWKEQEKKS